jgi:hypothetical protein
MYLNIKKKNVIVILRILFKIVLYHFKQIIYSFGIKFKKYAYFLILFIYLNKLGPFR